MKRIKILNLNGCILEYQTSKRKNFIGGEMDIMDGWANTYLLKNQFKELIVTKTHKNQMLNGVEIYFNYK